MWGSIGPKAVTRVMKEHCKNDTKLLLSEGEPQSCSPITIYPTRFFSPVSYKRFKFYIEDGHGKNLREVCSDYVYWFFFHLYHIRDSGSVVRKGMARTCKRFVVTMLMDFFCRISIFQKYKDTYLIHFWNKLSKGEVVKVGGDSIYDVVARTSCPITYQRATLRAVHFWANNVWGRS